MKVFSVAAGLLMTYAAAIESEAILNDVVADTIGLIVDTKKITQYKRDRGVPVMHADNGNECGNAAHLCNDKDQHVILQAGHHVRAKTDQPIIGILTQPLPDAWKDELKE